MKTLKTLIAAFFLACLSIGAQATGGIATNTTVSLMTGLANGGLSTGIYNVYTADLPTGQPSCATTLHGFAFDPTTTGGKPLAALLLSAALSGKTVTIVGAGTCTFWSGLEDVIQVNVALP